jgi:hypothetical protein
VGTRALILTVAVVITVIAVMLALIVWTARAPQPDRSGTVLAKRAYPETVDTIPMYDPTLHTVTMHTIVSGPDWALTVRQPNGQHRIVWVRHQVYDQCHLGDWYDGPHRTCRP